MSNDTDCYCEIGYECFTHYRSRLARRGAVLAAWVAAPDTGVDHEAR